jgi:hypothetical protein
MRARCEGPVAKSKFLSGVVLRREGDYMKMGRKWLTWVCVSLLVFAHCSEGAVKTLSPDQLKPGMKGYGLSVFKGTKPTRFNIEVLGVLKNAFPRQDMILIQLSGADLETHKVIAGMSGSPIYVDNKLIGALAYGWSFENVPLAGVTPIHNMLAELTKPASAGVGSSNSSGHSRLNATGRIAASEVSVDLRDGDSSMPRRLLTPLALAGFGPQSIAMAEAHFLKMGFLPVASGGTGVDSTKKPGRPVPGGAIGVQLIRGDLSASAVGTITYVDGNRILAFGHPFFSGGRTEVPVALARVHTIMSSKASSFKISSVTEEIGAMIGDWQSCIVADTSVRARMIPVVVSVKGGGIKEEERYSVEVIDNESLSASLVMMSIAEAVSSATGSSEDTTVRVGIEAKVADRIVKVEDSVFNSGGGVIGSRVLSSLQYMFHTPFGHPVVESIDVKVNVSLARNTAEIKRAYFSKSSVRRGEKAHLTVVLKPYKGDEVKKTVTLDVPATDASLAQLSVTITPGSLVSPDVAEPDSLNDYLSSIEKQHKSTDLVVLLRKNRGVLQYRGQLLKDLPASVMSVMKNSSGGGYYSSASAPMADVEQIVLPTKWVLRGGMSVTTKIED